MSNTSVKVLSVKADFGLEMIFEFKFHQVIRRYETLFFFSQVIKAQVEFLGSKKCCWKMSCRQVFPCAAVLMSPYISLLIPSLCVHHSF